MQIGSSKQRRVSGRKTRSGCLTCKIRHVKCGEEKPECIQCRRTGRKCDGYDSNNINVIKPINTTNMNLASVLIDGIGPDKGRVLYPGTREERKYVHFFCTKTSQAMSGIFPTNFWSFLLPQLSQNVPVIRHAAVAVAARHEHYLHPETISKDKSEQFSLQQYNKAIKHLMCDISSPKKGLDITLITCFLFVGLEILGGNHLQALQHMRAGVQILYEKGLNTTSILPIEIERELFHFILRMNIQLSLFGHPLMPFNLTSVDEELSSQGKGFWSDISGARHSLDRLMNKGLHLIRDAGLERTTKCQLFRPRQEEIIQQLQAWEKTFDRLMKSPRKCISSLDPRIPLLLRINHGISLLWVKNCLATTELTYDNHHPSFEAVVCYAEDWIRVAKDFQEKATGENPESFTLEAGIIPMLYWTASKCRHPIIRRRAIQVLRAHPAKEGLWNTALMVGVADMIVKFEEMNMEYLPIEQRIPADKARVYETLMRRGDETDPSRPCYVRLWYKPDGPNGPWDFQVKYVY
ncbi:hypothetical protein BGW36DRAFT_421113 [Talaromyces proteolyticus]|uniref:Zn(2)-C6 fungal-type domain-containing protein n=1 Tax=Talaromyces proteolyticus TaxID=1131652 RepID=A0AAD4KHP4_9EURO|nr:uncharacterized protein BGW36DRAFT_421113 [Talaromyces proteolyticus]KAH8688717.1 hypothetical protein BGW36DRAFT_421113 [Talaromyces proteolyticus]